MQPLARLLKGTWSMQVSSALSVSHSTFAWLAERIGVPLTGGVLIGTAAALLLATLGRIAGISGIVGGLLSLPRANVVSEAGWRTAFVAGLLSVGLMAGTLAPTSLTSNTTSTPAVLIAAGLLVGFGTRLGSGCTSGHGVCGVSRFSPRSIVATLIFIAAGAATVAITSALGGQS